jgi:hypothetical protein
MNENFITASLMGGLGNQLFQISHALAEGWKHNVDVIFPYNLSITNPIWEIKHYRYNIYRNLNFSDNIPSSTRYSEKHYNDIGLNFNLDTPVDFYGYFQSSKNFLGYEDKIKDLFCPPDEYKNGIHKKYPEINNENTLSLHIRRTDYFSLSTILPTIDISYFNEAVRQNGEYSTLFVFSDDKQWVKENLNYTNMIIVDDIPTYQELWLMSLCSNNIISNSSFSWWGAWLNNNKNKKVFVPNIWFGPNGPHPFDNVYEESWIKVNVKYINGVLYG